MGTRFLAASAAGLLLLVSAACGDAGATTAPQPTVAAPTSGGQACSSDATEGEEVAIADFRFTPAELTIPAGTAVAWTNNDSTPHTVTFDDGPDCGRLAASASAAVDFDTAGTFDYICTIHPSMSGTIIVE